MKKLALTFFLQLSITIILAQVKVKNLLCDNLPDPIGIDNVVPEFSWQLSSSNRYIKQTAYEIRVSSHPVLFSGKNEIWNSGKIISKESVHVPYNGKDL
ncbi:MAG: alpha-L-rhamnosidase, partial [Bacteroidota bacterium]